MWTQNCEILEENYREPRVTGSDCKSYADRYIIGDAHMALGLVLTREEYEEFRSRVYEIQIP